MLLFAGLGNMGKAFAGHRHNAGFMALDAIARAYEAPEFRSRFQGLASEIVLAGARGILLKPQTYMNESGRSAGEAARYYQIDPSHIVVFHDELDLPTGKVRVNARFIRPWSPPGLARPRRARLIAPRGCARLRRHDFQRRDPVARLAQHFEAKIMESEYLPAL